MIVKDTPEGLLALKLKNLSTQEVRDPTDAEMDELEDEMAERRRLREERWRVVHPRYLHPMPDEAKPRWRA